MDSILHTVQEAFQGFENVRAMVLGGSRASGTASEGSDYDIGVYYDGSLPFALDEWQRAARAVDSLHRDHLIQAPGEWGPWINGGGWLTVEEKPVDLLLREIHRVEEVIGQCMEGKITLHYQCGHPFAFASSIYAGEIDACKPILEKDGWLQAQKSRTASFPDAYRRGAAAQFLWEARFSLNCGRKSVGKKDLLYASGSLYRAMNALIQALYAVNGMYCLNEKGSLRRLLEQARVWLPQGLEKMEQAVVCLSNRHLPQTFDAMNALWAEISEYCARF